MESTIRQIGERYSGFVRGSSPTLGKQETLSMLSKTQANAISEALLEAGRQQRDRKSPLLAEYPELSLLAFAQRKPVLKQARRAAWHSWPVLAAVFVVSIFLGLWLWALFVSQDGAAESIWWAPFLAALTLRMLLQRQARRELRRLLKSRRAQNQ